MAFSDVHPTPNLRHLITKGGEVERLKILKPPTDVIVTRPSNANTSSQHIHRIRCFVRSGVSCVMAVSSVRPPGAPSIIHSQAATAAATLARHSSNPYTTLSVLRLNISSWYLSSWPPTLTPIQIRFSGFSFMPFEPNYIISPSSSTCTLSSRCLEYPHIHTSLFPPHLLIIFLFLLTLLDWVKLRFNPSWMFEWHFEIVQLKVSDCLPGYFLKRQGVRSCQGVQQPWRLP